jgi:hypothetical protein
MIYKKSKCKTNVLFHELISLFVGLYYLTRVVKDLFIPITTQFIFTYIGKV